MPGFSNRAIGSPITTTTNTDGDDNKNCQKEQTDAKRLNSVEDDNVNGYVM